VETYQVWAHGPDDFASDLRECLEAVWPTERCSAPFDLLVGEAFDAAAYFRAVYEVPLMRSVAVAHVPNQLGDVDWKRLVDMKAGPVARGAEPFVPEPALAELSQRLGGVLALSWRERPAMAYAAVFRQGRCDRSLYLAPGKRLARWDGRGVAIEEEPERCPPEGDRMGVLLWGLEQFAGGSWLIEADERLQLPEILAG